MRNSLFQFPQVVVLEASAGSGKTYALAKRYLQLILHLANQQHVPIQSILAITFTNKATWEMKSRILDLLKRMALKQLNAAQVSDILGPINIDEEKASKLAFLLMDDVIHQYHYFQVQTIDSFINTLLAGCSFKIGLSARFKIQRNSREYLQLALDELLEAATKDKRVHQLFDDFIRQYLFLENRGGWFPREDLLKVMATLFAQYNTYQKSLMAYPIAEDPWAKKRKIIGLIKELVTLSPAETKKQFATHLQHFLNKHEHGFDVDDLSSKSWEAQEFPVNKGGVITPELERCWHRVREEIQELCLLESHSMFNAYIVLFNALLGDFYQLSKRDDVLFLEELNRKAAALFDDGLVTVEELYFRLAARFRHYLIDEFQDTSLAQWRNLTLMVQEALSAEGSLFYVGDKKQAIYAFRGGESALFDALQLHFGEYVTKEALAFNWRSCPNIIAFNNRIFGLENLRGFVERKRQEDIEEDRKGVVDLTDADFEQIANTFGHSHQVPGKDLKGGLVQVSFLSGRNKEERSLEARARLIGIVQELRGRFALKDIAILTRGNDEVQEITQWLLHEGIDAQSERSSDIKNNPLINELIAFLTFLQEPIDNNAFAQFCLGELFAQASGLTCEELRAFLFKTARSKDRLKDIYFYKSFRDEFPVVWAKFIEPFFRQVGVSPLYELTAGIIARLGCERHFSQYQGYLMHLLQLIKTREEQSCDLGAFLEYYELLEGQECFVPMTQSEAIKVLTVHKAKGLEFPVVIIPFLEMEIKVGAGGRDGSMSYVLDIQEEGMGLIRLKESYRKFCPSLQELYEAQYKKALLLELNTVYVALTRAIEEMYVFVPLKAGNSINQAKFLFPEEHLTVGTPAQQPRAHEQLPQRRKIATFVDDQWLGRLREDFLSDEAVSVQAARQGEIYHALLMQVGNLSHTPSTMSAEDWPKIEPIVNAPALKQFFYLPAETQVFCEKEFVNAFGDTKRIDRLIVTPSQVWVVDYKASRAASENHQTQVKGYVDLVKAFYPKHKVEGYLVYLDTLEVESV